MQHILIIANVSKKLMQVKMLLQNNKQYDTNLSDKEHRLRNCGTEKVLHHSKNCGKVRN